MKSFFTCFVILVSSLLAAPQHLRAQAVAPPQPNIQIGEKLTYNISFAAFGDAGFAELQIVGRERLGERDVTRFRARVRTTGMVQATLLPLENEYHSLVAPESKLPLKIERTARGSNAPVETQHDFAENSAANGGGVHDLLSAIYYIRTLPLTPGAAAAVPLKIWENNQVYDAEMRVAGRRTVSSAVGAFNAYVVQFRVLNNEKYNRYRLQILLSDDDRRLPVSINLKHSKGEIRADLASVQIVLPEVVAVAPTPEISPTPRPPATPRPTPTPKPYVENQPLAADLPFALGEKLQYDVSRNNQKIGQVLLAVGERKQFFGRDAVQLSAQAEQISAAGVLTKGDAVTSYIHPDFLVPLRSDIRLGGALAGFNQTVMFDQDRGAATTDKGVSAEIPVGTHDLLSLVYALRAFRYDAPAASPSRPPADSTRTRDTKAAVFLGGTPVIVSLRAAGNETIEVAGAKIKAILLNVTTGDPQIDALGIRLWLSDDARRLPLRLVVNTALGAVQADLTNYTPAK